MRGISINGIHTAKDLNFVMTLQKIEMPTIKTYKTEVPGRNGLLDLSEFLTGDIQYNNRQLNFKFLANGNRNDLIKVISSFMNYHGRNAEIITDDFPDSYFFGRIAAKYVDCGVYVEFEISVDAEPFRVAKEKSSSSFTVSSSKECSVVNNGIAIVPTVITTATATIIRNGRQVSISAGSSYTDDFFKLEHGVNTFTIEGNAVVTFEFTEAFI